jgi:hypothetical protein
MVNTGKNTFISFGSASSLKTGIYTVKIYAKLTGKNAEGVTPEANSGLFIAELYSGAVDTILPNSKKQITVGDLSADGTTAMITISDVLVFADMTDVQFRLWKNNQDIGFAVEKAEIILDRVSEPNMMYFSNATKMLHIPNTCVDVEGENAIAYDPTDTSLIKGVLIHSQQATLAQGYYRLEVDVALTGVDLPSPYQEKLFDLDVAYGTGGNIRAAATTINKSICTKEGYSEAMLYFAIPEGGVNDLQIRAITSNNSFVGFKLSDVRIFKVTEEEYNSLGAQIPIYESEAELAMYSRVGYVDNGALCASPEMGANHLLYGPYTPILAGNYNAIVYAKIQNRDADSDQVLTFEVANAGVTVFSHIITASELPENDIYYAVKIPFSVSMDIDRVEYRLYYAGGGNVKVDKIQIVQENYHVISVRQDETTLRPDDTEAVNSYLLPITTENIQFTNSYSGHVTDETIVFDLNTDIPGGMEGLTDQFYLKEGKMYCRIYLKVPDEFAGQATFLQTYITQGGWPVATAFLNADDFKDKTGIPVAIDFVFDSKENLPTELVLNWRGLSSVSVEKCTFSDVPFIENEVEMNVTTSGNTSKILIAAQDLKDLSSEDYAVFTLPSGTQAVISVATLQNWTKDGNSVELVFDQPKAQTLVQLKEATDSLKLFIRELDAFDFSVILHSASGNTTIMQLPNTIQFRFPISSSLMKTLDENLPGVVMLAVGNEVQPIQTSVNTDTAQLLASVNTAGTLYSALVTGSVGESTNDMPFTGDNSVFPAIIMLLTGCSVILAIWIQRRRMKKRSLF